MLLKQLALPTYTSIDSPEAKTNGLSDANSHTGSSRLLAALTISASVVLAIYTASPTTVIGFSSVIFAAIGLVLFEAAARDAEHDIDSTGRSSVAGSESFGRQQLASTRDVAIMVATVCGIASVLMEPSITSTAITWEPVYRTYKQDWRDVHNYRILQRFLWTIPVNIIVNGFTSFMVCYSPLLFPPKCCRMQQPPVLLVMLILTH